MYVSVWRYTVRAGAADAFLRLYGPDGEWVSLFRRSNGFVRTELLRDRADPSRFITIDYWESEAAWNEWRAHCDAEYQQMDGRGVTLTAEEHEIGRFEIMG